MDKLIKYGLYFVVAFSVLAFGAAEVWACSVVEFVVFLLVFLWFAGGFGRIFVFNGAIVWIPAALFVLLVLFQMVPLPAGALKVVSPATYKLYEETVIEVGKRQKTEDKNTGMLEYWNTGIKDTEGGWQGTEVRREWRSISINKHGTLRMLLKFLAYMGIFFIVVYFNPSGQKRAVPDFVFGLIWVILFLGLFNAVFFFLQKASGMQLVWLGPFAPSTGNCLGTFKAFNNFSEFLEMVVPLAMGLLIAQSYLDVRRMSRVHGVKFSLVTALFSKTGLMSFGIILMISALLLSLCTGGFVTFPVTMIVVLVFMIMSYRLHDRRVFALFAFVLVGAACYLVWLGLGPIINELQYLFKDLGPQGRSVTYKDAVSIIKDFPLFGVGFGDWHDIIMKYHTMVGRETWMPAIAYNDTLQITAETGFAGLACVAAFLFMIYRKAIKALRRGGDMVSQALILGGVTAMTAALIHCQFDYLFYLPSNAVVFMVIAGITYRISN